jgi:osmoprotectant transport system ATP-binding protein
MSAHGPTAASLVGVTKRYGDAVALGPIDLDVPAGRTTVLLGPSGCGKSTLLRLINGLVAPDEGTLRVLGEAVTPASVEGLRRRVGYVIQEGGLFPHLSARQNVALLPRWLRWETPKIDARVAELAALARLPEALLDRHPTSSPGGSGSGWR